jgi:hypothetical protein
VAIAPDAIGSLEGLVGNIGDVLSVLTPMEALEKALWEAASRSLHTTTPPNPSFGALKPAWSPVQGYQTLLVAYES